MSKPLCIYHGNCADGFTAAWAVSRALGEGVEFYHGVYGEAPPDVTDRDVVMVDFSYKRPVLEQIAVQARSILILDHHKTAQADLAGIKEPFRDWRWQTAVVSKGGDYHGRPYVRAVFDMGRSGAQIAWDFFHPGKPRPKLVDYVADRDLWKFELTESRAIAAWVFSHNYDLVAWNYLAAELDDEDGFLMAVAEGAAIERKHHKDVAELVRVTRRDMVIGGQRVPVANLPYTMSSDAAGMMAAEAPFAACYYDRPGARVFSLRSRGEGGADVAEIAARYGGGGHKNAAGFQAPPGWEGDE